MFEPQPVNAPVLGAETPDAYPARGEDEHDHPVPRRLYRIGDLSHLFIRWDGARDPVLVGIGPPDSRIPPPRGVNQGQERPNRPPDVADILRLEAGGLPVTNEVENGVLEGPLVPLRHVDETSHL